MKIGFLARQRFETIGRYDGVATVEASLLANTFLVVLDDGLFQGILTAEDIVRSPRSLVADCIVTRPVVQFDDDVRAVLSVMNDARVTCLPVYRRDEFFGVCVRSDIAMFLEEQGRELESLLSARTKELHAETEARRAAQDAFHRAQKMEAIGTLAGGIAHDFNNMLVPIMACADLIVREANSLEEAREEAGRILSASEQARDLVGQLLTLSRRRTAPRQSVDLGSLVKETLVLLKAALPSTVALHVDVSAEAIAVLSDPVEMQQVLLNLFMNARHALRDRRGVLEIALHRVPPTDRGPVASGSGPETPSFARLTVRDTGCGMSPEVQARIFEPYFTTKEAGEGSGLGLAVVHSIVEGSGGRIVLRSDVGRGSTFEIYLPCAAAPTVGGECTSVPPSSGREHILVVDDNPAVSGACVRILERLGYQVTTSTDSRKALELCLARPAPFDLVVANQTMPELTGIELLDRVRQRDPEIAALIMSGGDEKTLRSSGKLRSETVFLAKPFSMAQLATVVRAVLDHRSEAARRVSPE